MTRRTIHPWMRSIRSPLPGGKEGRTTKRTVFSEKNTTTFQRVPCHEAFLNETLLPDVFNDPRSERHRSFDPLKRNTMPFRSGERRMCVSKTSTGDVRGCISRTNEKQPKRSPTERQRNDVGVGRCSESKTGLSADPSMARAEGRPLDSSRTAIPTVVTPEKKTCLPHLPFEVHRIGFRESSKRGTDAPRPRRRAQTTSAHRVSTRIPPPAPHAPVHPMALLGDSRSFGGGRVFPEGRTARTNLDKT